ncbi:hypothetical protein GOBAR_AA00618 [Gossypium barbadense]|uniref:DUF4283 domain-containing protein n=1 Tax=Gossypium barbadense TaxID=3634 RepID=A0A2P5YWH6_GOSBA|nr:hypothetical protein GOBAR_AA00618 [Gossypium barbadense]
MDPSLYEGVGFDDSSIKGLITKKVYFRDKSDKSERESAAGRNTSHSLLEGYGRWKFKLKFKKAENGYFLARFQNNGDSGKVLSEGPWIIYGQYLTVQPQMMNFNPTQPFSNVAMAWIRLLGLPRYMYKRKILLEIGGMVGSVAKLDLNTDSRTRGRLARLTVYVSLHKPQIFKVLVNDKPQRIEYEFLLSVCFECGRYGHIKETFPN